MELATSAILT